MRKKFAKTAAKISLSRRTLTGVAAFIRVSTVARSGGAAVNKDLSRPAASTPSTSPKKKRTKIIFRVNKLTKTRRSGATAAKKSVISLVIVLATPTFARKSTLNLNIFAFNRSKISASSMLTPRRLQLISSRSASWCQAIRPSKKSATI